MTEPLRQVFECRSQRALANPVLFAFLRLQQGTLLAQLVSRRRGASAMQSARVDCCDHRGRTAWKRAAFGAVRGWRSSSGLAAKGRFWSRPSHPAGEAGCTSDAGAVVSAKSSGQVRACFTEAPRNANKRGRVDDLRRERRQEEDSAVSRRAADDAEQVERGAADDDCPSRYRLALLRGRASNNLSVSSGFHGISVNRYERFSASIHGSAIVKHLC